MKVFQAVATSTIGLSFLVSPIDGQPRDPRQRRPVDDDLGFVAHPGRNPARKLMVGGDFLPSGEKPYLTGLRFKEEYAFKNGNITNDFVILELERPNKFAPVKLAAVDGSDDKAGEMATTFGWGNNMNETRSNELKHEKQKVASDEECLKHFNGDDSVICAGGVSTENTCFSWGEWGSPLLKETPNGEDVVIGLMSWGDDCGATTQLNAFGRVSKARTWIESITDKSWFK
ncbi:hypothetical protein ON010_g7298 [Phytophthora cinnamomi]|nr:hypothetical protein ON010_g7298 [Phytophthora cinnamomi]